MNKQMKARLSLGTEGRMIGTSRGRTSFENPHSLIVFLANVVIDGERIWQGDLNLSDKKDIKKLETLSRDFGSKEVFILWEKDAGFDVEVPRLDRAIGKVTYGKGLEILYACDFYELREDGTGYLKEDQRREEKVLSVEDMVIPRPGHVDRDLIALDIELPDTIEFKSKDNDQNLPYMNFYQYLAGNLNMDMEQINTRDIVVSKNTAEELNRLSLAHLRAKVGNDEFTLQGSFNMLQMAYAPRVADWVDIEDNVAYIIYDRGF
jgi:hypothetical protein